MLTRPIGSIFSYKKILLRVITTVHSSCESCYFIKAACYLSTQRDQRITGACSSEVRNDFTEVSFKKI